MAHRTRAAVDAAAGLCPGRRLSTGTPAPVGRAHGISRRAARRAADPVGLLGGRCATLGAVRRRRAADGAREGRDRVAGRGARRVDGVARMVGRAGGRKAMGNGQWSMPRRRHQQSAINNQ